MTLLFGTRISVRVEYGTAIAQRRGTMTPVLSRSVIITHVDAAGCAADHRDYLGRITKRSKITSLGDIKCDLFSSAPRRGTGARRAMWMCRCNYV